jgi:hypothetical protein
VRYVMLVGLLVLVAGCAMTPQRPLTVEEQQYQMIELHKQQQMLGNALMWQQLLYGRRY